MPDRVMQNKGTASGAEAMDEIIHQNHRLSSTRSIRVTSLAGQPQHLRPCAVISDNLLYILKLHIYCVRIIVSKMSMSQLHFLLLGLQTATGLESLASRHFASRATSMRSPSLAHTHLPEQRILSFLIRRCLSSGMNEVGSSPLQEEAEL